MEIEQKEGITRTRIVGHNKKLLIWIIILLVLLIALVIVIKNLPETKDNTSNDNVQNNKSGSQLANPASVYCEHNLGKLEIRADSQGNQYGVCIFSNSKECEEWAYFRGECNNSV